jgi:branched-chain amino acid transport system ATP-binding protein
MAALPVVTEPGQPGRPRATGERDPSGWQGATSEGVRPVEIARLGVGFAPEEREVFGDLTVAENVSLPIWTRQAQRAATEREALTYRVFANLKRYRARGGQQPSGGVRKMASIARALALDEPSEGLSPTIVPSIVDSIAVDPSTWRRGANRRVQFASRPRFRRPALRD